VVGGDAEGVMVLMVWKEKMESVKAKRLHTSGVPARQVSGAAPV